jgi:cation transport regulator ChaC
MGRELWIFGYGSLIWRPDFAFAESCPGFVTGWSRRFWQGSVDHRGVPEAPGRVVTLASAPDARCGGLAYRVEADRRDEVLARLDHRESGGFERVDVQVTLRDRGREAIAAITWVAPPSNPNYLGPAPMNAIALQVRQSRGPSGSNREYALRLAESLRALGIEDEHVFELAAQLVSPGRGGPATQSPAR